MTLFDASADSPGEASFVVMELVDGPDLAARLSLGPLEPADAAVLGAQIAAALDFLHARGTVHGAVRPDNILLGRDVSARTSSLEHG